MKRIIPKSENMFENCLTVIMFDLLESEKRKHAKLPVR